MIRGNFEDENGSDAERESCEQVQQKIYHDRSNENRRQMSRSRPLTSILLKVCSKLININVRQHDRMEQDPFSIHCYFLDHIAVGCNRWSSQE